MTNVFLLLWAADFAYFLRLFATMAAVVLASFAALYLITGDVWEPNEDRVMKRAFRKACIGTVVLCLFALLVPSATTLRVAAGVYATQTAADTPFGKEVQDAVLRALRKVGEDQ